MKDFKNLLRPLGCAGTSHLAGRFEAQNGAHDVWLSDES